MKNLLTLFSRSLHTSNLIYPLSFEVRQQSSQWKKLRPAQIKGVVTDLGGTALDPHVIGPAVSFIETFKKHRILINIHEAREPMGLPKKEHIAAILKKPSVQHRWMKMYGALPSQKDVNALYADFVPIQLAMLEKYSKLTEGTAEAILGLQKMGVKVGCSTGFTEEMVEILKNPMRAQGCILDAWVASDTVEHGARPCPHMIYKNMDLLGIHHPGEIVKVGDTEGDIGEGLAANTWTVAVYKFSNYTAIESLEQLANMPPAELKEREEYAREMLEKSGAHYVVDTMERLSDVVKDINERIQAGETPESGSKAAKTIKMARL